MVFNSLLVGHTENANEMLLQLSPSGVVAPRTEWFTIKNCSFHNYDFKEAHALSDCAHCESWKETDSGARTVKTSQLTF
jgi:hypothetical protein